LLVPHLKSNLTVVIVEELPIFFWKTAFISNVALPIICQPLSLASVGKSVEGLMVTCALLQNVKSLASLDLRIKFVRACSISIPVGASVTGSCSKRVVSAGTYRKARTDKGKKRGRLVRPGTVGGYVVWLYCRVRVRKDCKDGTS